jgi:uncharacterized protein YjeT (DUF2065 family)
MGSASQQPGDRTMTQEREQPAPAAPPPNDQGQTAPPPRSLSLEERFERFGQEAEEAGKRLGREAEDYGKRLSSNTAVKDAADTAGRVWGLLLIAVGAWFFAEFTLGYELPAIPWRDVWPIGLIAIGLVVVVRGLTRRSA